MSDLVGVDLLLVDCHEAGGHAVGPDSGRVTDRLAKVAVDRGPGDGLKALHLQSTRLVLPPLPKQTASRKCALN